MADEYKNVKRIVAPDYATLNANLKNKQFGLDQSTNTAYFRRSDGTMVPYISKGGNAEFSTMKLTNLSGAGSNIVIDSNGNLLKTSLDGGNENDWKDPVISIYDNTTATPASPSTGDRYIALVTANTWTINNIYEWDGASWIETPIAVEGTFVYVQDQDSIFYYTGSSWVLYSSGVSSFLGLTDTPSAYTGNSLKAVRVNTTADALEFYTPTNGLWEINADVLSPILDTLHTQLGNNPNTPLGKLDLYVDPSGTSTITISGATDTDSNGVYTKVGLSQDGVTYYYNHATTTRQIIRDSTDNYYCIDNKTTNTNPAYNSTVYCNFTGSLTGNYLGIGGNAGDTAIATADNTTAGIGLHTNGSVDADNGFFIDGYSSMTYDTNSGHLQIDTLAATSGADFVFNSNGTPRLVVPVEGDGLGTQFMRSGFFGGYEYQNRLLIDNNIDSANLIFDTNFVNFNTFTATPTATEIAKPDVGIAGALQVIDGILLGSSQDDGNGVVLENTAQNEFTIDFDKGNGSNSIGYVMTRDDFRGRLSTPAAGSQYFDLVFSADSLLGDVGLNIYNYDGSDHVYGVDLKYDYLKFTHKDTNVNTILTQNAQIDVIWDGSGVTTDPFFNTTRDFVVGTPKTDYTDYSELSDTGLLVNGLSALHYYKNSQINAGEILNHYGFSYTTQYHNYADLKAVDGLLLEHYSGDGSNSNSTQNIIGDSSDGFTFYKHHFDTSSSVDESNTFVFSLFDETVNGYQSYLYKNDPLNDGTFPYTTEVRQYRDAFEWLQNDNTVAILDSNTFDISSNDLSDIKLPEENYNIRTGDYSQIRLADGYNIQMISNAYYGDNVAGDGSAWRYAIGGSAEATNLWVSTGGLDLQYAPGSTNAGDPLTWTELLEVKSDKCEYKGKSLNKQPKGWAVKSPIALETITGFYVWEDTTISNIRGSKGGGTSCSISIYSGSASPTAIDRTHVSTQELPASTGAVAQTASVVIPAGNWVSLKIMGASTDMDGKYATITMEVN